MWRALSRSFITAVLVLSVALSAEAVSMKAGVAKVDITPPTGVPLWGYFDRLTGAQGTLDPLYARVLVLEVGEKRLALVDLDYGRTFGPASIERIRAAARQSSGISYVLVQATHTHAGPVILDEQPSGVPAWETAAIEKVDKAIQEAHQRAVEVRLGAGYGQTYIGYNRRRVSPDGTVTMLWRNKTHVPTAPVDPTVSVLRIDTAEGKPLAVLVNYSCHPVVFGPDNLQYSADFPGVMTQTVEQAFGANPPLCFFMQGAPGDINVYDATTPLKEDAIGKRDWSGQHLGEEAARVAKAIHTEAVPDPSLDFVEDPLPFRLRWNLEKLRKGFMATYGADLFKNFSPRVREDWQLPVATVLINKRLAMMTMPGEPFVEFQINWRDRCPVPDAFFLGYANGYYGYFPTLKAATEGGYGTASSTTCIEVGAGERMVNHALVRVYEMLGRLTDTPEDLKK
ncbi:MAG: neutral/alkaline non-lysosomal ceramidase N-terminal domain-containing protein [Acidobacteriia bacterium]|nr:neutral/alkaline non-lysosomal ceramidase N-terminal domain-containing protein [Terriglobia bacterium]